MGEPTLLLDLEGHGREEIFDDVDLSRTVGWFTTIFPVLLNLPATSDLATTVKTIKEQLREIPNRGIGYGLLRYLSGDESIAEKLQTYLKLRCYSTIWGNPIKSFQNHRRLA
jgi:hypothetical protein